MRPFLKAEWNDIVMVNYKISPPVLEPYLPAGVELDFFEDAVYVSLVGFRFSNCRIFNIPVPFFGTFNEVNLRFYVKRKVAGGWRRGVVFISEIVPYRYVASIANKFYKEHYSVAKLSAATLSVHGRKSLTYKWLMEGHEYSITADFLWEQRHIEKGSLEEFIYEHYFGYTKVSGNETWEYKVNHPRWLINPFHDCRIECDFRIMYGDDFANLNDATPTSVFNAVGSTVAIDWKKEKIKMGSGIATPGSLKCSAY